MNTFNLHFKIHILVLGYRLKFLSRRETCNIFMIKWFTVLFNHYVYSHKKDKQKRNYVIILEYFTNTLDYKTMQTAKNAFQGHPHFS